METVDFVRKPRAVDLRATRSVELSCDAAQLRIVSGTVLWAAREVCARSEQIVLMIEQRRRLRSLALMRQQVAERGSSGETPDADRRRTTTPAVM